MSTIPKAVLETFPKKIYLQTTDEDECEPFIDNHEATWCNQRMHISDVEYVRADIATDGREELEKENERLRNGLLMIKWISEIPNNPTMILVKKYVNKTLNNL